VVVNPVTGEVYVVNAEDFANNVTVILPPTRCDTKVRAILDPVPGCTTCLARPALAGKAVNRWTPNATGIIGVLNRVNAGQRAWNWAGVTSWPDSVQWTWEWGDDSLVMGENFVCCVPLEDQAAVTNNLGLGTPFAGNMEVYPVYRMEYHVGQQEPGTVAGRLAGCPTIVRGVLMGPRLTAGGVGHDLLDATGRKVMDIEPGENDIRHLSPGVYFVRPEAEGHVATRKVVIQK
jgi:hypothetical protein